MVLGLNKVYRITLKLKDVTLKNNLAEHDYHQDEINQVIGDLEKYLQWNLWAVELLGKF